MDLWIYWSIDLLIYGYNINQLIYWSIDLSICQSTYLSTFHYIHTSNCRSIDLSVYTYIKLLIYQLTDLSTYWYIDLFVHRFMFLQIYICIPESTDIQIYGTDIWYMDISIMIYCRYIDLPVYQYMKLLIYNLSIYQSIDTPSINISICW